MAPSDSLTLVNTKTLRFVFWPLWFIALPLGLAWLTVSLLSPGPQAEPGQGLSRILWLIQDQPIPALIVFFTVYEMLLYHNRHSLPLAGKIGIGGRTDLPREVRKEYEQALQLLDDAERILRKRRAAVEREVPSSVREDLVQALEQLRDVMSKDPFDHPEFTRRFEQSAHLVNEHLARWQKSELREYAESIGIAIAVALLLRAFVVEAFKIPSGSMLPTLQIQDHIFVNKFSYGPMLPFLEQRLFPDLPPARGDIMVFQFPDPNPKNESQDYIKRVIALEGDTLEVDGGHPIINGWRVPSCEVGEYRFSEGDSQHWKQGKLFVEFLGEYSYLTLFEDHHFDQHQGPYKIAPGETWVLGDNRNNSSDSRAWNNGRGGGVPHQNIKGRAMFVWLSFGSDGWLTLDRLFYNVLGRPRLPEGAPQHLVDGIVRCLKERPSDTDPPPPG